MHHRITVDTVEPAVSPQRHGGQPRHEAEKVLQFACAGKVDCLHFCVPMFADRPHSFAQDAELSWSSMPRLLVSVHPTREANATQAQREHRWSLLGSILSAGAPVPSAPADPTAIAALCRLWHICVITANHRGSSFFRHGLQQACAILPGATLFAVKPQGVKRLWAWPTTGLGYAARGYTARSQCRTLGN